jgi:cystathionine beta-lyase
MTGSPLPGAAEFDFDRPPARDFARSMRWARYRDRDVIPLWVADMDFAAPPAVVAAVQAVAADPVYGYPAVPDGAASTVVGYCRRRYGWEVDAASLVWLPGLVPGLNLAVAAAAEATTGAGIVVMPPIYPPFLSAPVHQRARRVSVPLTREKMDYTIDFARLAEVLDTDPDIRLLLFCHPHNPVGRAWRIEELAKLAEVVRGHDLLVCSDEVHCDLVIDPARQHRPLASLPGMAGRTITLMAPSKTYNIAGLGVAWAVIEDEALRQRFRAAMRGLLPPVSAAGFAALLAALGGECEPWRQSLLAYLAGNREQLTRWAAEVGLPVVPVEATFLAWLDARHHPDAHRRIAAAGVALSDGADFGAPGFLRLNFGTQRSLLTEALARIGRALA